MKLLQIVAIIKPQLSLQVVLITGKAIRYRTTFFPPALFQSWKGGGSGGYTPPLAREKAQPGQAVKGKAAAYGGAKPP